MEVYSCGTSVLGTYRNEHFETAQRNIFRRTCIHKISFARLSESQPSHMPSGMTTLAQSPAIDVVGIGFASGEISIYDIRADEKIMRIFVREGPVRALAFRGGKGSKIYSFTKVSCLVDGHPALASASETGHISLWDLGSGGRLLHTIRGAHDGSISSLQWIPGQPLLISSGDDNSVKVCVLSRWKASHISLTRPLAMAR